MPLECLIGINQELHTYNIMNEFDANPEDEILLHHQVAENNNYPPIYDVFFRD